MPNTAEILERLESTGTEIEGIAEPEEESTEPAEGAAEGEEKPAVEGEKKPETDKPGPKKPDENRIAAQFAALARTKAEARQLEQAVQHRVGELQRREEALTAKEQETAKILAAFEKPEHIFTVLHDKFGLKTIDDLKKYAEGTWKPPAKEVPPEERPLTRKEYEELRQRDAEAARIAATRERVYGEFAKSTDDGDAALIWDAEERCKEGDKIADEWNEAGIAWTMQDIAEELEKRACKHPRYAKIQKRGAATAPATKVASEAGQQGLKANGAKVVEEAPEGETKKQRLERLAKKYLG